MESVAVLVSFMLLASACAVTGAPVEQTDYGRAPLRLEVRPDPMWFPADITVDSEEAPGGVKVIYDPKQFPADVVTMDRLEKAFAEGGVKARWLSVVDPLGNPYYDSKFIPTTIGDLAKRERLLKEWVAAIHKQGMAAISWYPLIISKSGVTNRPEWRQKFIISDPPEGKHRDLECCINSGYGDALISFCNEAIEKFGLDGIWFDGSAWTQIWDRPVPLSCVCDNCARLFKRQTGLAIPSKANWDDPTFRRWVAWRYETFGAYIGRLAAGIRKKHPNAVVVINHYHRPMIPWQSAIPLNPYDADIISGSEAQGEEMADLTMRLCRAYGRAQSEVWMRLYAGADPDNAPETDQLIHHALTCVTAGGLPSYGTTPDPDLVPRTTKHIAAALDKLAPYVCKDSVPYAALHLSQQTETFYLSRDRKGMDWVLEPFWQSIKGWTQGLMQAHISPDYIYDKRFKLENLKRYKALLLPMSIALSDAQCRTIIRFAERGGVVVLGPGTAAADEWGEKRAVNPLEKALGFRFRSIPSHAASERVPLTLVKKSGQMVGPFAALHSGIELKDGAWRPLYGVKIEDETQPGVAVRSLGQGKVVVLGVDIGGTTFDWEPAAGGDTSIHVTGETAAQGKRSLKFTDGPNAPQTFYPDMEINFRTICAPAAREGRLSCALRIERGAQVCIEGRETLPRSGHSVNIGRDGKLWAQDKPLCDVPMDQWFRLEIRFRLAGENRTYDLTLDIPGESPRTFSDLPYVDPAFDKCNWTVIYGDGTDRASFYLDDLKIESMPSRPDAAATVAFQDDFEGAGPADAGAGEKLPSAGIAADLLEMAPSPIELDGPHFVRMAAYRRGRSEAIVHLHNILGSRKKPAQGDPMTLRVRFPISSASLALSGAPLAIETRGEESVVKIPPVALHEVVVLVKNRR